jgi:hypothetical protein
VKSRLDFVQILLILSLNFLAATVLAAQEAPQTFTFDGRAFSDAAATTPLLDTISLRIQILNQAQDCILYEEQQSVSTATTNGYFTIQVGSVTGAAKRSALDSNHTMAQVYSNTIASVSGKLVSNGAACTYNPLNANVRYVRLLMTPSDNVLRTISPNMALDSHPYAAVAERADTLQGLYPTDLLLVNSTAPANLTQANLESIFSTTNFPRLTSLLSIAPSNYVQTGSNGSALLPVVAGNPGSGLTSGQIWYDSTANVLKYYDGAVKTVGAAGGAAGPLVDNTNSASTAIAVTQSGSGFAGTFMGGNVGIGTVNPSQMLTVGTASGAQFTASSAGNIVATSATIGGASSIAITCGGCNPPVTGNYIYSGQFNGYNYYYSTLTSFYINPATSLLVGISLFRELEILLLRAMSESVQPARKLHSMLQAT